MLKFQQNFRERYTSTKMSWITVVCNQLIFINIAYLQLYISVGDESGVNANQI